VGTITTALTALKPVTAVHIDLDTEGASAVRVSTNVELTREQVQDALKGEGNFTVVG
jgi:copper chaperone CopZ